MNKREVGTKWELLALAYLEEQGVRILEHSFRCKMGEIDLIGMDEDCLVFFEVKYRNKDTNGMAEEAVNYSKQRKICRVSDFYRLRNGISDMMQMRYDVLAINDSEITWYKNAFFYIPK